MDKNKALEAALSQIDGASFFVSDGVTLSLPAAVVVSQGATANFQRQTFHAEGAGSRLRAILMTSFAMIAGMTPMALGLGESGEQSAPLGRAVIGGLAAATLATLFILPSVFMLLRNRASTRSRSLDPTDPLSGHFVSPVGHD